MKIMNKILNVKKKKNVLEIKAKEYKEYNVIKFYTS